jgi:hypothetical protein
MSVMLQTFHLFEAYAEGEACTTYAAVEKQQAKKCGDNEKLLWVGKPGEPKKPYCDEKCPEGYSFDPFGNLCKNDKGDKLTPKRRPLDDICPSDMVYQDGKCYESCKTNHNLRNVDQTYCVNSSNASEDYAAVYKGDKLTCPKGQSSIADKSGNWYCYKNCPLNYVASFDEASKKVKCAGKKKGKDDVVTQAANNFSVCGEGQSYFENACWETCKPNLQLASKPIVSCTTCAE